MPDAVRVLICTLLRQQQLRRLMAGFDWLLRITACCCAMLLQVEVLEQVFRLLRVVPRFSRQAGSSSSMLGAGGTLTDDIVVFSAERAKWTQQ